jgi:ferrous iron transport protein B
MPTLRATLLHMWDRASQYLRKMGGIILAFSLVIWFLGEYPKSPAVEKKYEARMAMIGQVGKPDARRAGEAPSALEEREREFSLAKERLLAERRAEEKRYTMIGRLGDIIHPLLRPLGFNWQMGISLSTGFVAKEIVVSTMGVLYHTSRGAPLEEELKQAEHGITPLVAYTFMLFVLLYVPCLATIVVIGREAGWSWAAFSIAYQLSAAWVISFLFYRAGLLIGW